MAVIDADAHVVEWEKTWDYMSEAERPFAPRRIFGAPRRGRGGTGTGALVLLRDAALS